MSAERRGATLIELLVAAMVSGLLLAATIVVYTMGARAWAKTEAQVDLLQHIQVVLSRFVHDGQASKRSAITVDPVSRAVCFPASRTWDVAQNCPLWDRYCLYYYDPADQTVRYRELDIAPPTAMPTAITGYDDGSGPHPITHYTTGGRILARSITDFQPGLSAGVVTLALRGQQTRAGSIQPEVVGFGASVRPRNP